MGGKTRMLLKRTKKVGLRTFEVRKVFRSVAPIAESEAFLTGGFAGKSAAEKLVVGVQYVDAEGLRPKQGEEDGRASIDANQERWRVS